MLYGISHLFKGLKDKYRCPHARIINERCDFPTLILLFPSSFPSPATYSLTIYFASRCAQLPPERELVPNECHVFYVFWFLCSSQRETRADDF